MKNGPKIKKARKKEKKRDKKSLGKIYRLFFCIILNKNEKNVNNKKNAI